MKNNKEKLFGLMKRLDESFTPLKEGDQSGSHWSFVTSDVDTDVYDITKIIKDKDITHTPTSRLNISWHIEPEFREWGIKSLIITIDKIEGAIDYVYYESETDSEIDDSFNIEDINVDWEYKINYNFSGYESYFPSIAPTNIELFFDKGVCEVDFI